MPRGLPMQLVRVVQLVYGWKGSLRHWKTPSPYWRTLHSLVSVNSRSEMLKGFSAKKWWCLWRRKATLLRRSTLRQYSIGDDLLMNVALHSFSVAGTTIKCWTTSWMSSCPGIKKSMTSVHWKLTGTFRINTSLWGTCTYRLHILCV